MAGVGETFKEVKPGQQQLQARQINQFIRPADGFTRLDGGRGLAVRKLAGGIQSIGSVIEAFASAVVADDGPITGCDDSGAPAIIVPGRGWIHIRVDTIDGLVMKSMKELCLNRWKGEIPAGSEIDVIKSNGYWRVFAGPECPTA